MNITADIILVIILLAGVIGTLFPVVPGTGIILAAAALHAVVTGLEPINGTVLIVLTVLCVVSWVGQYALTAHREQKIRVIQVRCDRSPRGHDYGTYAARCRRNFYRRLCRSFSF